MSFETLRCIFFYLIKVRLKAKSVHWTSYLFTLKKVLIGGAISAADTQLSSHVRLKTNVRRGLVPFRPCVRSGWCRCREGCTPSWPKLTRSARALSSSYQGLKHEQLQKYLKICFRSVSQIIFDIRWYNLVKDVRTRWIIAQNNADQRTTKK